MTGGPSALHQLSRDQLAVLVPELLLAGHLIDRSGLPHALGAFGADGMRDIAIEEWMGASPVYTRRMQRALGFEGDDVTTLFKGLQLDIGAPPQFMDFRFTVHDRDHGEFALAHCGALMDVEPIGEDYVRRMCHDIEDPTFDATAVATNPRAQVRPIHRPPRVPADRAPHCAWTVIIDDSHPAAPIPPRSEQLGTTAAARWAASEIDPSEDGRGDYAGPLLADVQFAEFSRSALVRIAEEVCLQGHLLTLAFVLALRARVDGATTVDLARKQFTGVAGVAAARIHAALGLPAGLPGAALLLGVHPAFNPAGYVDLAVEQHDDQVKIRLGRNAPAGLDGAWPSLLDATHLAAVDAIVHAADPTLRAEAVMSGPDELVVLVTTGHAAGGDQPEVQLTRISTGASFVFVDRGRSLPLTVVTKHGG